MDRHRHVRSLTLVETGAVVYLLVPTIIFAASFLRLELAVPSCALMIVLIVEIARGTIKRRFRELISWEDAYFISFTILWVGFFFGLVFFNQVGDWVKHYAVLNLLTETSWPPVKIVDGLGLVTLRYYIGWYLVPALLLRLTDNHFQLLALFLWSAVGMFIFLRLVRQILSPSTTSALLAFPLIIALFDVPNYLARLLTKHWLPYEFSLSPWWAGWISYAGNSASLSWVPQHTIGGWIAVALLMRQRDHAPLLPYCILLLCSVALWSPFSAVGLVPFLFALAIRHGVYPLFAGWRALASLALVGAPVALYLTSDLGGVSSGFVLSSPCLGPGICFSWLSYTLFIVIEVGSPLLILCTLRQSEKGFLATAALTLLLIPFYKMGMINDFGVRASLPALMVICILCAKCLISRPSRPTIAIGVILLAAIPDFKESITEVLTADNVLQNSTMHTVTAGEDPALSQSVLQQYFARLPVWVLRKD